MEARKSTTAGVVFWTPAPVRASPTSSVESEDEWEDEDEEQAERDDDFLIQMDENGIIGLSEALEDVELVETYGDTDAECNSNLYCRSLNPEKADTLEQLSYDQSEHLAHTESRGDDVEILPPCDNFTGSRKAGEKVRQSKEKQGMGCLPGRDKYLDMTEEGKDGGEAGKTSNRKKNKTERSSTARELITTNDSSKSSKGETRMKSSVPSCSAHLLAMEPAGVSSHNCPVSQPASPVTAPTHPHLLHFTPEEVAAAPWIEAETLPEMSFTESLSESHMIHLNLRSSPRCPEIEIRASPQPAAMFSEEVVSNHYNGLNNGRSEGWQKSNKHHKQPTPSARKMRHLSPEDVCSSRSLSIVGVDLKCKHQTTSSDRVLRTPRTRSNAAAVDESRKRTLSYRTPDFSKVEPRVRIPKGGYKPPKSKRSSTRESLSPEPPLVFKSPADIVKEVLLNMPDGPSAPSDSDGPAACAPDFTVPRDFRCRRQATTLLEQLQEDYNTLLTKYAEAENTIDRLRLEAKVNLYSDPAKPSHMVQSGLNQEASRLMTLDFPQAQRVEISSASCHPDGLSANQRSSSAGPSTRSPDPHEGQQPAKILYNQADKFLQQLQNFEELQKNGKLRPFDQVKGLSQLAEGLESLERGYLLARDEHKLLLQRGAEIGHFDPERELEGLIFQCGLLMDELKEQVEQMTHEQATCEAPPSAPPHPTPPSVPCEGGESLTHPQDPPVPLPVEPGVAAVAEVSPASEESYEAMEDEETLYLKTLNGKHRCADRDFATPTDHYQSFKELPKLLVHGQRDGDPFPAALRIDVQPGEEETTRQSQGGGNQEVQKSVPQRKSDHEDSPPLRTSKQQTSRSSPPSHRASSKSTTLPTDPPSSSRRRFKVGKSCSSSLSSLGDITALERRNSKLQSGRSRVLSQDGIISPETDSGFVGSESSRLTPAAAPSPLHQRASESVSVPEEGKPRQPQTGLTSAPSPACSPSHCCPAAEPTKGSRLSLDQPRRSRQGQRRCTLSSSPQRWVSQTEQGRADSGTSDFGLESVSTHTVSEDRQNGRYTESISSFSSSSLSSSPTARHHRGDSVRALSSSQVASPNDAVQTLQAEVTRLKERIESYFRNKEHPSSVRATPSAQENCTQPSSSTPCIRSGERWSNDSRGRRDVDESTPRRTTLKKPPSAHRQKPQANLLTAPEPSTPQPQPQVSRFTQTSAAAPDGCPHANTVHSRTHPRQRSGVSPQACDTADEPDSRSRQVPLCPQCLSRHQGRPERPAGGNRELTHSCHRCPLCGCPEPYRSTEPDCRRVSHSNRQPAESPDGAARSRLYAAADPPALLQYMPVCPPPFLLYSPPLFVSPSNSAGSSSGVRGRGEASGRTRRSRSADKQRSLDSSLNRAIRAARHMKLTSGHMACSLASGLHYQELLTHSCSY